MKNLNEIREAAGEIRRLPRTPPVPAAEKTRLHAAAELHREALRNIAEYAAGSYEREVARAALSTEDVA